MTSVKFGMLQKLKTQDFKNNSQAASIQRELNTQSDIFTEAKTAFEKASANGTEGIQAGTGAFAQTSMSIEELETKMNEEQEKLEKLMTALSAQSDKKTEATQENKDDKKKVKPKEFQGLMA